ncbi:MAG: RcpC/CpaB family pilus assembly protein [Elusimicrobiota bacterium]|nr:MAG: RcpC/CpaB family pilus assembly protein [Elusimicrobiota bacterium]
MNRRLLAVLALLAAPLLAFPLAARAIEGPLTLTPGYRAMTMPFPEHQLAYLEPGDRADMLATFEALTGKTGATRKEDVTVTFLQNVRVLAVDRSRGLVQLEVNPNEAQYAALFSVKERTLWLIERTLDDKELKPMVMASARKLFLP